MSSEHGCPNSESWSLTELGDAKGTHKAEGTLPMECKEVGGTREALIRKPPLPHYRSRHLTEGLFPLYLSSMVQMFTCFTPEILMGLIMWTRSIPPGVKRYDMCAR